MATVIHADSSTQTDGGFPCTYIPIGGKPCGRTASSGQWCFWHDPDADKSGDNIAERLEQAARDGAPMDGFILRGANLEGVNLSRDGNRRGYSLQNADLSRANLHGAHLFGADLRHANLIKTHLREANLNGADLRHANLLGVMMQGARLEHVDWGDRVLQDSMGRLAQREGRHDDAMQSFEEAEEVYRSLRQRSDARGHHFNVGEFFQREMIMRRFQMPFWSMRRLFSKLVDLLCGYGENPVRIVTSSMVVIAVCAVLYFLLGINDNGNMIGIQTNTSGSAAISDFFNCLYFSVVTFTTLGYGDLTPIGATRAIAATQAYIGAFMMALFVLVFSRRMAR